MFDANLNDEYKENNDIVEIETKRRRTTDEKHDLIST